MDKLFFNCNLFDGTNTTLFKDAWFVVNSKGRISNYGTSEPPHNIVKKIDLNGKYVMPGLINAHTHIMMYPITNKTEYLTETEITVQALHNLELLLKSGQTYIRDCGCAFNVDIQLARLSQNNGLFNFKIPEIMPSGRPLSMTGGHGDFTEGIDGCSTWGYLTDSPNEVRKAVRNAFKLGAKNIKVMATGGVMSATDQIDDTELSLEELKMAVTEAHSKHMTVAAHAEGGVGIHNAVMAGVDSIEHGSYISDEDITIMKKQGTFLVPTLIAAWTIAEYGEGKLPQYMLDKTKAFIEEYFKNIEKAIKNGVKFAFGTDAGTPFNKFEEAPYELQLLVQNGATNFQALQAAGKLSSELLGIDADYGTLELGKFADFLVLDDNPLIDVKAVQQNNKQVYKKGHRMF